MRKAEVGDYHSGENVRNPKQLWYSAWGQDEQLFSVMAVLEDFSEDLLVLCILIGWQLA